MISNPELSTSRSDGIHDRIARSHAASNDRIFPAVTTGFGLIPANVGQEYALLEIISRIFKILLDNFNSVCLLSLPAITGIAAIKKMNQKS